MNLEEKFSLLLWDYQELERAFEKATGGKWVRKSNTPQRQWVGLDNSEVVDAWTEWQEKGNDLEVFAQIIEAKLKEKNV